jgi:hypothetical protein
VTPLIDGETQYRIGLLVQVIDEAGPHGISLVDLAAKTGLEPEALAEVLALCLARDFVKRSEGGYVRR